MNKYFVSKQEKIIGPFSVEEIQSMLKEGDLDLSDHLFDQDKDDWFPLMTLESFKNIENSKVEPEEKIKNEPKTEVSDEDWFVLRGEKKYGPFIYLELIKMLQEHSLFEFDFVWNPSMNKWSRIAELRDFSPEKIRNLTKEAKSIFFRRKHPRADFGGSLILHDNQKVWHGENIMISEGGCSIKVFNSMIQPGDNIFIHFKPNAILPPFHAKGEVVSKRFDPKVKNLEHPIVYGVKFTEIEGNVVKEIRDYIKKAA